MTKTYLKSRKVDSNFQRLECGLQRFLAKAGLTEGVAKNFSTKASRKRWIRIVRRSLHSFSVEIQFIRTYNFIAKPLIAYSEPEKLLLFQISILKRYIKLAIEINKKSFTRIIIFKNFFWKFGLCMKLVIKLVTLGRFCNYQVAITISSATFVYFFAKLVVTEGCLNRILVINLNCFRFQSANKKNFLELQKSSWLKMREIKKNLKFYPRLNYWVRVSKVEDWSTPVGTVAYEAIPHWLFLLRDILM